MPYTTNHRQGKWRECDAVNCSNEFASSEALLKFKDFTNGLFLERTA
jgi:hypothetical protein